MNAIILPTRQIKSKLIKNIFERGFQNESYHF